MLQKQELQSRFNQVAQTIHHTAEVCASTPSVPMDLKNCVQQLDTQSERASSIWQSQSPQQMSQYIDQLEQLGDQARDACERSSNLAPELRQAVMQTHQQLSDLKHQLH